MTSSTPSRDYFLGWHQYGPNMAQIWLKYGQNATFDKGGYFYLPLKAHTIEQQPESLYIHSSCGFGEHHRSL